MWLTGLKAPTNFPIFPSAPRFGFAGRCIVFFAYFPFVLVFGFSATTSTIPTLDFVVFACDKKSLGFSLLKPRIYERVQAET